MTNMAFTKEEKEVYEQLKRTVKFDTDEDLFRWLLKDWKRLTEKEKQLNQVVNLVGSKSGAARSPYSLSGVSIGKGLQAVGDKRKELRDRSKKIDL